MSDQRSCAEAPGLRRIRRSLDEVEAGAELRRRVSEHYAHLVQLSENLKTIGLDEAAIDEHVMGFFERYGAQLMQCLAAFSPSAPGGSQPC